VLPVRGQAISNGAERGALRPFGKHRHVGRRRRWRGAQDVVQDPLPPQYGRGTPRAGGDGEDGALAQDAAPLFGVGKGDLPEPTPVDAGNAVVPSQTFVQVRVIRLQQLEHAGVLPDAVRYEQLRLLAEPLEQTLVVGRIDLRVHHDVVDPSQVQ